MGFLCCSIGPVLLKELQILGFLVVALYSCVFGSLLAIFVPQTCLAPGLALGRNGTAVSTLVEADCSLAQNIYIDISPLNGVALFFNFLLCALLLAGFAVEFRRERFIVMHFGEDPERPEGYLETDLMAHDELRLKLIAMNTQYYRIFVAIFAVAVVNVGVSGALVFSKEYYNGYRTVTTFVTNTLFMAQRLANSIILSTPPDDGGVRAQTVNLVESRLFNVVRVPRRAAAAGGPAAATKLAGGSRRALDVLGLTEFGYEPRRYGRGTGV